MAISKCAEGLLAPLPVPLSRYRLSFPIYSYILYVCDISSDQIHQVGRVSLRQNILLRTPKRNMSATGP